MAKFFADASFFVALYKKDDSNHKKAQGIVNDLEEKDEIFINYICIGEAVTIISQRVGKSLANKLLEDYNLEVYQEIEIDKSTILSAVDIFLKQRSKNFPFFDAVHFATMKETRLKKVLGFDKHFKKFGFEMV